VLVSKSGGDDDGDDGDEDRRKRRARRKLQMTEPDGDDGDDDDDDDDEDDDGPIAPGFVSTVEQADITACSKCHSAWDQDEKEITDRADHVPSNRQCYVDGGDGE